MKVDIVQAKKKEAWAT